MVMDALNKREALGDVLRTLCAGWEFKVYSRLLNLQTSCYLGVKDFSQSLIGIIHLVEATLGMRFFQKKLTHESHS